MLEEELSFPRSVEITRNADRGAKEIFRTEQYILLGKRDAFRRTAWEWVLGRAIVNDVTNPRLKRPTFSELPAPFEADAAKARVTRGVDRRHDVGLRRARPTQEAG